MVRSVAGVVPLLSDPVSVLVRALHIVAAVVWLAGLWLATWFEARIYPTMTEEARGEFARRMSAAFVPWLTWGAILTFVLGALLYWDLGSRIGFPTIAWAVDLGVLVAVGVVAIQLAVVAPYHRKMAANEPPAAPNRHRATRWSVAASLLSAAAAILMLGAARLSDLFR